MFDNYTAENIRILSPAEVADRWDWAKAIRLAEQYRRPVAWIQRGLEACRRAGVPAEYFEQRYLRRDKVARKPSVEEAFRELLAEAHPGPRDGALRRIIDILPALKDGDSRISRSGVSCFTESDRCRLSPIPELQSLHRLTPPARR